jgi:hypothetical protein
LQEVWLWNFEGCARKTSKDNNARAKTVNKTQAVNKGNIPIYQKLKNGRPCLAVMYKWVFVIISEQQSQSSFLLRIVTKQDQDIQKE